MYLRAISAGKRLMLILVSYDLKSIGNKSIYLTTFSMFSHGACNSRLKGDIDILFLDFFEKRNKRRSFAARARRRLE